MLTALKHPRGAKMSDGKISKHVGVDDKTVAKYRAELQSTSEIPKSSRRTGRDGRTIDTSNIGRPRKRAEPAEEAPQPDEQDSVATSDKDTDKPLCPNCGHDTFHENGDCTKCKEPNAGPPCPPDQRAGAEPHLFELC